MAQRFGLFDYVLASTTNAVNTLQRRNQKIIQFGMPAVHFTLKHFDGMQFSKAAVGSDLLSEDEIDRWVDFLKNDLDRVASNAKRALKRAKALT